MNDYYKGEYKNKFIIKVNNRGFNRLVIFV